MNVELVRIAYAMEGAVAQAAGLEAGRSLYVEHRLPDLGALAGQSREPGEYEYVGTYRVSPP